MKGALASPQTPSCAMEKLWGADGHEGGPPSHEGPPPVTHGGRGPSRRPGGPVRPPPALPSRDSAAAGAVCSDTRAVTGHLRAPGTVARSRESPALIKGCGRDDGALRCSVFKTVSTGPRGTVRLLGLASIQTEKQEEGPCGMSSSVQVCFQAGAGRGHRSGTRLRPGVRSAWSVPTSVLSDEARNPSALQGRGGASSSTDAFCALAPALSAVTRHPGVRVSDRTCSPERRGAGATWVDLGTPRWLKCDSVGIDLRPCVRPRKGPCDGGLRLPGPRTDVRGGGGVSV